MNWSFAANLNYDVIEEGLNTNIARTKARCDLLYTAFVKQAEEPGQRDRVTPFLQKAKEIRSHTDSLYVFLEQLRTYALSKKRTTHARSIATLLGQPVIDSLRNILDQGIDHTARRFSDYNYGTVFRRSAKQHWKDTLLFAKTRPEGLKCVISLLQEGLYYNELAAIQQLYIEAGDVGGCCLCGPVAIAISTTPYAVPGQKVTGILMLANYPHYPEPTYMANTGKIIKVENGVATWNGIATHLGLNTITGISKVLLDTELDTISKPYSFQFFVGVPFISMNIDKANTCYVNEDNPITISVPGYSADKLSLKVKDAQVTRTAPGKFNIYFSKIPSEKVYAFVDATNEQGTTSTVASLPIAVKYLPTPRATISGANNGYVPLRHFRKATGIDLELPDIDFDMSYSIVSYKLSLLHDKNRIYIVPIAGKGQFSKNPGIIKIMDIARTGDKAIFEDITVRDANGRLIELAPIILKLD